MIYFFKDRTQEKITVYPNILKATSGEMGQTRELHCFKNDKELNYFVNEIKKEGFEDYKYKISE